ncbi:MAG: cell division protein FtsZ [Flavobacteriales bacterium]|nr:cell division protein FtsZ [Flavobacteriales bacterium]
MSLEFNIPKERSSILKVIGVGGGGSNAVNHMYLQGIKGVDFIVCNTDQQALDISPVPFKVQIGQTLTGGRGAGAQPEVGRNAAVESIDELKDILADNTTMVFITAGMGGGTGTGAAPVIAQTAKEMGILTVGIVTIPFGFEGPRRKNLAEEGLENLRNSVDTLLVIKNDKLRELHGNLSVTNAFHESDNILTTAAKGIAEVISSIGYINVDMNDVNTVMKDSGVAIMGSATADGEGRAEKAVMKALESPLLNDNNIKGARHVLLNITFGTQDITMDELDEITHFIQAEAGDTAEVIMGYGQDDRLGEEISVTVIATGFEGNEPHSGFDKEPEKTYRELDEDVPTIITAPIEGEEITRPLTNPLGMDSQVPEDVPLPSQEDEQPFLKDASEEDLADKPLQQDLGFDFAEISGTRRTEEPQAEQQEAPEAEKKNYFDLFEDEKSIEEEMPQQETTLSEKTVEMEDEVFEERISLDEHRKRVEERMERIKEHGMKLRTPSGLSELESEPAYKRKNMKLDDVPHSSESNMSKYTLTDKDTEGITLSKNNPFLDKNVD